MRSHKEIERILSEEVERSRIAYDMARQTHVTRISPDLPPSDGQPGISNATMAGSRASQAFNAALREFNAFLVNGDIPQRLKEEGKAAAG